MVGANATKRAVAEKLKKLQKKDPYLQMITWGIVANSPDDPIGVFDGHKSVWAGMAKDFSGKSNDPYLNWENDPNPAIRTITS